MVKITRDESPPPAERFILSGTKPKAAGTPGVDGKSNLPPDTADPCAAGAARPACAVAEISPLTSALLANVELSG